MVRRWVFVSLVGVAMLCAANQRAVSVAQEAPGAVTAVEKTETITARQQEWLRATPEQRVGLAELLGEDGGRALAKKNGYEAICDGLERILPQGPDQVYRTADGRIVVYEVKGGTSPLGHAYGYQQGTPEWAAESAKRVLKSAKAGAVEKAAAREVLKAAAEYRLTVQVVRTKHRLGEPFVAVVEQSLNTTDDAARLARATIEGLGSPAAAGAQVTGEIAKVTSRAKIARVAGKALVPVAIGVDGACRAKDSKSVEERFASGEITQQGREVAHARNGAGFVGGWGGAWVGAEIGATTGGAIGTVIAPGPGTAIGAAVGGAVGGVTGYFAGEAAAAKTAEWTVQKIHRTGNTLAGAWNWVFRG
ncbi:MAG: hypothetical protein ACREHD_19165 [Pirellulales bacterium]